MLYFLTFACGLIGKIGSIDRDNWIIIRSIVYFHMWKVLISLWHFYFELGDWSIALLWLLEYTLIIRNTCLCTLCSKSLQRLTPVFRISQGRDEWKPTLGNDRRDKRNQISDVWRKKNGRDNFQTSSQNDLLDYFEVKSTRVWRCTDLLINV